MTGWLVDSGSTTPGLRLAPTAAPPPPRPPAGPDVVLPSSDRADQQRAWSWRPSEQLSQLGLVDPRVVGWFNQAADQYLPPGYSVELAVGPASHNRQTYLGGPSQVPLGKALDVLIYDAQGNPIDNRLHQDPNSPTYKFYQGFGNAYIKASGGHGRWGGYYSDPDVMQFGTVMEGYPRGARAPDELYNAAQITPAQMQERFQSAFDKLLGMGTK
jgi:hypothetical protein